MKYQWGLRRRIVVRLVLGAGEVVASTIGHMVD